MCVRQNGCGIRGRRVAVDGVPDQMAADRYRMCVDRHSGRLPDNDKGVDRMRVVLYKSPKILSGVLRSLFKIPKTFYSVT